MALTATEITELKKVVVERDKQKAIEVINTDAYDEIRALQDQMRVLEDKRVADIQAL